MYKNDEIYGDIIEFYDIAAFSQPNITGNISVKFAEMTRVNTGVILDIGAGTGKMTVEMAKLVPDKEVIALEPSKYMRIAFMSRLMEHEEERRRITVLPWTTDQYDFEEEISGILCMGVLGHLKVKERQCLWEKLKNKLGLDVPVLVELLDPRFLNVEKGSRISVAIQGRLRYETYITDIKRIAERQWEWLLTYRVSCGEKIINVIESPMCWTYDSAENVLSELAQANFRGVKLSDTLLLARKS